ncbi:coagulation factor X [Centroberyx gerrardi]|uniref:coagulation factor X n=1 Tax=Centroberyx gerrardi TaxID=166262 RepID=UPI003AAB5148
MFWFCRVSLCLLLLHQAAGADVFLDSEAASQVLTRQRRANSPFEEFRKGNYERECVEERCDKEEMREIYENDEKTDEEWNKYVDGNACDSNPCAHGGDCKDGIGRYICYCKPVYQGYNCEIAIPELCENKNGGCEHFCKVSDGNVRCSCAGGYFLGSDDKSCRSNETYKCGAIVTTNTRTIFRYERPNTTKLDGNDTERTSALDYLHLSDFFVPHGNITGDLEDDYLADGVVEELVVPDRAGMTRIVNGEQCPPGECPWQALLLNEEHRGFCGGTILNEYFILTAAHCMNQSRYIYIILGEFDTEVKEGREAIHNVEIVLIHKYYKPETYHNDISLIKLTTPIQFTRYIVPACLPERDFAEKVLMRQPDGMVSGFGRVGEGRQPSTILQRLTVPYVDRAVCIESSQFTISKHMFCAGYDKLKKDACQGDSGGPHVTRYLNTYFVTGVVSWGEGCAREGKYGIYTQVSKYIPWIRNSMAWLVPKRTPGVRVAGAGRAKRDAAPFQTLWV